GVNRFLCKLRRSGARGRGSLGVEPNTGQRSLARIADVRRRARVAALGALRDHRAIAVLRHGAGPLLAAGAEPAEQRLQDRRATVGVSAPALGPLAAIENQIDAWVTARDADAVDPAAECQRIAHGRVVGMAALPLAHLVRAL